MKIPTPPPNVADLMARAGPLRLLELIQSGIGPTPKGDYLHWDKLRHLQAPPGYSVEEWWLAAKLARMALYRALPFTDKAGHPFRHTLPDLVLELLHRIDRAASSELRATEQIANRQTRDTYIIRSLMEEAITSSQLEGASTTHRIARDMLREGRKPRTPGEQMIANNYRGMQFIRQYQREGMTPGIIMELHRILVADTHEDGAAAGRLRRESDDIHVVDNRDGTILHTPPDARTLPERLDRLCRFANDGSPEPFLHPVIRAIILHFLFAYDHPFVDGNGRTARALFYWSMLRQGYWLAEYISISRILRAAPAEYARAYLYTETDDGDISYFVVHQLRVMLQALDDLHAHLARHAREVHEIEDVLRDSPLLRDRLNHRQITLLGHALRHPHAAYHIAGHRQSHNITYETARTDLLELAALNLLRKDRVGRAFVFRAPGDLAQQIKILREHSRPPHDTTPP
ncbi:MAG: Fic family protein [Gammaproteobacteria bacterium]|nr:Fic family protein [Gammaproteobacteria bacterium]